jgi:RimJ/RimL family protein N-acetyltransferase
MTVPTLITPRLTLRGGLPEDAEALGRFMESPRAAGIGGPYPASDAAAWIASDLNNWATRGTGMWIVTLTATGEPIGRIGALHHPGWEPELGWHLFDGYEGQGYAFEAASAARDHLQDVLGLPPVFSFVEPTNPRSRALALRMRAVVERQVVFDGVTLDIFRHVKGGA